MRGVDGKNRDNAGALLATAEAEGMAGVSTIRPS
jgi:hypothetical protein